MTTNSKMNVLELGYEGYYLNLLKCQPKLQTNDKGYEIQDLLDC